MCLWIKTRFIRSINVRTKLTNLYATRVAWKTTILDSPEPNSIATVAGENEYSYKRKDKL